MPRQLGLIALILLAASAAAYLIYGEAEPLKAVALDVATGETEAGHAAENREVPPNQQKPEHRRSLLDDSLTKADTDIATGIAPVTAPITVTGWVTVNGQPAKNVEVVANASSQRTDPTGHFRFESLPPGITTFFIRSQVFQGSLNAEDIELIHDLRRQRLQAGETLELQFPLRTITIKGRLIASGSNQNISGQVVLQGDAIQSKSRTTLSQPFFIPTHRDGSYEVRGLPAGSYTVSAFGLGRLSREYSVKVEQGTLVHDIVLDPTVNVSGELVSVTEAPTTMTLSGPTTQTIKLRGRKFRCRQLIPGTYKVTLHYDHGDTVLPHHLAVSTQNAKNLRL